MNMKACVAVLAIGLTVGGAGASVTINEIRIDQPSSDVEEYFELAGNPFESLDNLWYIVLGDDSGDGSGDPGKRSGSIEAVIPLGGLFIPADGYFLCTEATFNDAGGLGLSGLVDLTIDLAFENGDNVSHLLVSGFTGAVGDVLDLDRDGIIDVTPWTALIDGISLIETNNPPVNNFDEWNYGYGGGIGPDGTFVPGHVFRFLNGGGPWNIGAFSGGFDTPGVANLPAPGALALLGLAGVVARRRRRG